MARKLEALPLPSASLGDLPILTIDRVLLRVHPRDKEPGFWGRTGTSRFDAPDGQYGVLYAAETFDGAFIETFGDLSPKIVSAALLAARGLATIEAHRPFRLVDLAEAGLSKLGLDARISTGDHALSQQWSRAIWAHSSHADGVWYAARHDPSQRSVALFDRAASAVTVVALTGLMDDPQRTLTAEALKKYGFALLP